MVALLPADIPAGCLSGRRTAEALNTSAAPYSVKVCRELVERAQPNLEHETGEVKDRDRSGAKFRLRAETGEVFCARGPAGVGSESRSKR